MNEIEIFNAAVKLSLNEQAKFLDLACKDNPELRGQVESLLKAHFDSATFLHESKPLDTATRTNPVEASVAETVLAASLSAIATWRRNTEVLSRRIFGALCSSVSPWFK